MGVQDAIDAAEAETRNSRLPGPDSGGPGNAYKHLLITGELYRRRGPTFGPTIAELRELANDALGQTADDAKMDRTNNAIVVNERPHFETWEDVVRWARAKIVQSAKYNGDGEDGRAAWYEKQPKTWRPDFKEVPITPIEKGGPEYRYRSPEPPGGVMTEPMGMAKAADPLARPVASWTEEDLRAAMNSPAYLEARHPKHREVQRDVRAWFERRFGTGPIPVDASGRAIQSAEAGACPVPVRAHSREGGKVKVDAHCRSIPAG
ncbi:MAG: hypothetical protein ACREJ5_21035 [Geminicoccaceae bacterium]